jgi:hypothetical protein
MPLPAAKLESFVFPSRMDLLDSASPTGWRHNAVNLSLKFNVIAMFAAVLFVGAVLFGAF